MLTIVRKLRGDYFKDATDAAKANYIKAIDHYRNLKLLYISQVNKISAEEINKTVENLMIEDMNNVFTTKYDENYISDADKETMKSIFLSLATDLVLQKINGDGNFQDFELKIKELERNKLIKHKDFKHYYARRKEEVSAKLTSLFEGESINKFIYTVLGKTISEDSIEANIETYRGMIQRALLILASGNLKNDKGNKFTYEDVTLNNEILSGFSKNLGGFAYEVAIEKALREAYKLLSVKMTKGALVDQKESTIDILISTDPSLLEKLIDKTFLSTLLDGLENGFNYKKFSGSFTKAEFEQLLKTLYGVLSKKGWVLSEKTGAKFNDLFYSLGLRSELLNSLGGGILTSYKGEDYQDPPGYDRGWHNAVYLVSTALFKVIGMRQVLFRTKTTYIWTDELLLSLLLDLHLYLNFYFQRENNKFFYPATPEMAFLPVRYLYLVRKTIKKNRKK